MNDIENVLSKPRTTPKDFFLNLGAIVALYTVVISLLNLLFAVINHAYPQIVNGYNYIGSQSISWPVAIIIIFFPIFILLMWLLEKGYKAEPDRKYLGIKKWLTYITLFVAGLTLAIDLATVLFYLLDGRELTAGFILKVSCVLMVALVVFLYYISDIREKLNSNSRRIWVGVSLVIILGSIIWGFSVLGSPMTQRLYKYDNQKITDLQNIDSSVGNYYAIKGVLPETLADLSGVSYIAVQADSQTQKPYEYNKTGDLTYELCAEFNKASSDSKLAETYPYGGLSWTHPAGRYCFAQTINTTMYPVKPVPIR